MTKVRKSNKQRTQERPLRCVNKDWWLVTNWGIPLDVHQLRQDAVEYIMARSPEVRDCFEIRKVRLVEVKP